MKAPDIFGIVIRVFGLAMTVYSLWSLVSSIAFALAGVDVVSTWFFVSAIGGVVLGIYFLRGAPQVLSFFVLLTKDKQEGEMPPKKGERTIRRGGAK